MRLTNSTDIPNETVRAIIRAVRPSGIGNFDVRISNTKGRGAAGSAYTSGSGYHATVDPFLVVRVARTDALARVVRRADGGYLSSVWGSRIEALLFVLAHELRHMWQAKHTKGKVWGARGRFSERDADAYGLRMLRRFRRGELDGLRTVLAHDLGSAAFD